MLHNLGVLCCEQQNFKSAVSLFNQIVKKYPQDVQAWFHLARALEETGQQDLSMRAYKQVLALAPEHARAQERLGMLYEQQQDMPEALAAYRLAYEFNPSAALAEKYFRQLQHACLWHEMEDLLAALHAQKHEIHMPLCHVTCCDNPAKNLALNQQLSAAIKDQAQTYALCFSHEERRRPKEKLTIGYLSCDFHDNATAHLMRGLFSLHDRSSFHVHAYSYGADDGSRYRHDIEKQCDAFIDIRQLTDADAAKRIHADEVDILVELKGYTVGHRMGICALKPAPVQITWLGFPGTTGADFMDYILTDRIVTPEEHASYYTEKFIFLPHSYQINDRQQSIVDAIFTRAQCGLPDNGFIFCSFNQPYKIEPVMFGVWMRILRAVPGSVLWLFSNNPLAERNLKREASAGGIAPDRILFATRIPKSLHLARIQLAGLALDTRICGGHTTTSDALWAGVPVITLQGNHFASRVSASLLQAVSLPELVTHSLAEYERLAVTLATQTKKLEILTSRLAVNRSTEPLFDTARFVQYLETAYRAVWNRWVANQVPAMVHIAP